MMIGVKQTSVVLESGCFHQMMFYLKPDRAVELSAAMLCVHLYLLL